jgi:hypothetical protein
MAHSLYLLKPHEFKRPMHLDIHIGCHGFMPYLFISPPS